MKDDKVEAYRRHDADSFNIETDDDVQLELLGYKQEFKRDFSFIGLWSLVSSELAVMPGIAGSIWCVL